MTSNITYSCAVFLLDNKSRRVHNIAERNNINLKNNSKIIAFSFHSYTDEQLAEIKVQINNSPSAASIEYLKKHIKIPDGINVMDVIDILNTKKQFKNLKKEDNILAGIEMERTLIKGVSGYVCLQKPPASDKRIYAILLDNSIVENKRFLKHNPDWDKNAQAFYIGQTAIGREERYNQHITGILANYFVKHFGVRPYVDAESTYQIADYFKREGIQILVDNLRHYQALYYERKLAEELRKAGNGAYAK